jgi:hypothetical protein
MKKTLQALSKIQYMHLPTTGPAANPCFLSSLYNSPSDRFSMQPIVPDILKRNNASIKVLYQTAILEKNWSLFIPHDLDILRQSTQNVHYIAEALS